MPAGMGAEAGAPARAPACLSDQECQNDSACDGDERCTATGCEAGPTPECEHKTICDDAAAELCVYEQPSPWLLATSLGALVALPAAQLGRERAFTIAPQPGETPFEGFNQIFWAPDGKVAIIRADEEEFGASFHHARFGAGLPSAVSLLPDVPNFMEGETTPYFSADSEYVFIYDYLSGTYLLNLKDAGVPTRHIPPVEGSYVDTMFCADQRSWFAWAKPRGGYLHRAWIGSLEGDEIVQRSIGETDWGFGISNDRRLLVLDHGLDDEGNELGFVLRPCSNDAWAVEFPRALYNVFSPDSKYLWVEDDDGVQKVLSLDDPRSPVELFSSVDLGATLLDEFTPDSKHLRATIDGIPHLVDLGRTPTPLLLPLGLPDTSSIVELRNAALLAWPNDEAKPGQLVWQAVPPSGTPIPILDNVTSDNSTFFDDTLIPDRVFVARAALDESELFSILLDGSAPEAKLLITIDGTFDELTATPDQAGIVFARSASAPGGMLMFAPFEPSGELGTARVVAETGYVHELQPWP
jgi:hypothetical protein